MTSKLNRALALAADGFHVFPIEAGVKAPPRIDDFPTKASRDADQIRRWWTDPVFGWEQDFNIGISTSRFGADEALLVVDIDNKGDKHGDETILGLEAEGRVFPDTFVARTPTGGRHLIYRTPVACRQGANVLGDGVDIRSYGGYVVGAGSVVSAGEYTGTPGVGVTPAPEWLVTACGLREAGAPGIHVHNPRLAPGQQHQAVNVDRAERRALLYLHGLAPVTEGERNHACFRAANKLKDLGVPEDACAGLLWDNWKCEPMLDEAELALAIGSAYRATKTALGCEAPEVQFAVASTPGGQIRKLDKTLLRRLLDFCGFR